MDSTMEHGDGYLMNNKPVKISLVDAISKYGPAVSVVAFLFSVISVYIGVQMAIADNKRMVEFAQKYSESVKLETSKRIDEVKNDVTSQSVTVKQDLNERLTRLELAVDGVKNSQVQLTTTLLEIKLLVQQNK